MPSSSLSVRRRTKSSFLKTLVVASKLVWLSNAWIISQLHGAVKMYRFSSMMMTSSQSTVGPVLSTNGVVFDAATLAGDCVIGMSRELEGSSEKTVWTMYPIAALVELMVPPVNETTTTTTTTTLTSVWTEGTRAVKALEIISNMDQNSSSIKAHAHAVLTCFQHEQDHLEIDCEVLVESSVSDSLIRILQLLQAQWVVSHQTKTSNPNENWKISIGDNNEIFYGTMMEQHGLEQLFGDVLDRDVVVSSSSDVEWVEMMTGSGQVIGRLPRSLVHKHNLLHRGIGVFVTKDRPIDLASVSATNTMLAPDIYVHQRASSKRIFPSLYDMFVGGVSTAGELSEVTAQREVAEELGLSQALVLPLSLWSDGRPILTCLVCTSYNRCLVDLYQYVMNTERETISWQEEEVSWGEFVPYDVISAAADLSMQRAANEGSWPGIYPPIQSHLQGMVVDQEHANRHKGWDTWDFVPDGLLVWNAWLEYLGTSVENEAVTSR
ncbi:NUDIX domain containing protein [Nitzschia inconspicua]|uniref:NUDIX domain containing protein n=1 Tax=Nitzschia inconspicua TaxID=303405 RepID=A0A9K3PUG7_9STRA|nr:NUDIX domain containing protein [Nitzschia inconspicua]